MLTSDDRVAIHELYARYNHAIDAGRSEDWAACFAPGGTFDDGRAVVSGEGLAKFAEAFAARVKGRHWTNNLVLDEDGDGVAGSCYLMLMRLTPGEQPPASPLVTAIYRDRVVRTPAGWKFASRKVHADS
jgi:3-phenylpropionate/cinnamic acid dioxygenase small subunit